MIKSVGIVKNEENIKKLAVDYLSDMGLLASSLNKYILLPGFSDVHVHFREPGFLYKESIKSGSLAAAAGGYTSVCTMPNLNPVPDTKENLDIQLEAIKKHACIKIIPYGSITVGENGEKLSDMEALKDFVCGFTDDGRGVQRDEIMRSAMLKSKSLGKIIVAHCEDNNLIKGGYIHDGIYAKTNNHRGICSESEYGQIERDLKLVRETGCAYHICHISTKESVDLIRNAKKEGLDVSCETAPHYLILCDEDLQEDGRFKMNPPIRGREDREALIKGIQDGTIDMIATDHAPHTQEEKSRGLEKSLMGVVGLEVAFSVLYTELVMKDLISLDILVKLLSTNPKKRFGIETENDFTVFDISKSYKINPDEFLSKGKSTAFEGREVYGKCILTVYDEKIVYKKI